MWQGIHARTSTMFTTSSQTWESELQAVTELTSSKWTVIWWVYNCNSFQCICLVTFFNLPSSLPQTDHRATDEFIPKPPAKFATCSDFALLDRLPPGVQLVKVNWWSMRFHLADGPSTWMLVWPTIRLRAKAETGSSHYIKYFSNVSVVRCDMSLWETSHAAEHPQPPTINQMTVWVVH
jgi:hypothetical protein